MSCPYKFWDNLSAADKHWFSDAIISRTPLVHAAAKAKGWPCPDVAEWLRFLDDSHRRAAGLRAVVILDSYLLLYTVGESWWVSSRVLCEEFLLAVRDDVRPFADALAIIESLAKDFGCGAVCIGTAASPSNEVYSRLLQRSGYKPLAYQLVKEV